jgi:hypothetical protein
VKKLLGLDVGGANIKACLLKLRESGFNFKIKVRYSPIWKLGKKCLEDEISETLKELMLSCTDALALTMTAELADVFKNKKEGVFEILNSVKRAIKAKEYYVLNNNARLIPLSNAYSSYKDVAGANYSSLGWLASKISRNCIVIDVGSTTTDIIPVKDGKLAYKGKDDVERLANGELVYTGSLRTNLACIVNKVPYKGKMVSVSSELFSTSADIHLVLGNISKEDYTIETANGRGKSKKECIARISRLICADVSQVSEFDVMIISKYIYNEQVKQIADAIIQVLSSIGKGFDLQVFTCGIGCNFLAKQAALIAGLKKVKSFGEIFGKDVVKATPAFACSLMLAEMEGIDVGKIIKNWR